MKSNRVSGIILAITSIWAILYTYWHHQQVKIGHLPVKLSLGPKEFGIPDIWDPPPKVMLFPDGSRKIQGYLFQEGKLPIDFAEWLLLQPFNSRGVTLVVAPDTPLQKVINFLDEFQTISEMTTKESLVRWNLPGQPAKAIRFYYSDTLKPWVPREPLPMVEMHEIRRGRLAMPNH